MSGGYELKPNKTVFVTFAFLKGFAVLSAIFLIWVFVNIGGGNSIVNLSSSFFVFIAVCLIYYYYRTVRYKKEKYIFLKDKIIHKMGGIFSDSETELTIRNITHVTLRLPFIQNKLFGTGNVKIESAGSGMAEVFLAAMNKPGQVYEYVMKIMKMNGFKLTKSKLVQTERPSSLGVFFEVLKNYFGSIFGFAIFVFYLSSILIALESLTGVFVILGIVVVLALIKGAIKFLDLKLRVYNIYSDVITYKEGFLSKNFSFIPVENLADSSLSQTLVDRIFGLNDVKISSQGSRQQILFKNMKNGPEMEENIDALIKKNKPLIGTVGAKKEVKKEVKAEFKTKAVKGESKYTGEFRMELGRSIFPTLLLLPLFPLWLIMFVLVVIKVMATTYFIKPQSMKEEYKFISKKHREFSNDKMTAVTIKENFVDKWFGTCSIRFWSIGSSEDITFRNIKKTPELYEKVLAKAGVKKQEVLYALDSKFSVGEMLKAVLPLTIMVVLGVIASVLLMLFSPLFVLIPVVLLFMFIVLVVYKQFYYRRSKLRFYKDYVYFQRGIFFREYYHALYDNVKDIKTLKYPFSMEGSITFNVAGEHVEGQGNQRMIVSNAFRINYIENIDNKDELIDLVLAKRPSAAEIKKMEKNISAYSHKPIMTVKPDIANSVLTVCITCVILVPLIVILPFILIFVIWSLKVTSTNIENYRVVKRWGILYKSQKSVVFGKIDHINYSQGMFNKLFKNGSITVNTVGSSSPELVIANIPEYKQFYDVLKKYY